MFASHDTDGNLVTFMTDRWGGVSEGAYSSLNLGGYCGDDEKAVLLNRKRLCDELHIQLPQLVVPKEVHGDCCVWVTRDSMKSDVECDALITTERNVCVCVTTADCVPVLLYDVHHTVCAAVHAGWKGVVNCILTKTIAEICDRLHLLPFSFHVVVNPCISVEKFEVGEEVASQFEELFPLDSSCLIDRKNYAKPHIDLRRAVALQALSMGVDSKNIQVSNDCTFQDNRFFSARRDGFATGRMVSGVMVRP